jgi:hypothetical protein
LTTRSHGDGRRMSLAEAVERRARVIRFWGTMRYAYEEAHRVYGGPERQGRNWGFWLCMMSRNGVPFGCGRRAPKAADVTMLDGECVAACPACRGAA